MKIFNYLYKYFLLLLAIIASSPSFALQIIGVYIPPGEHFPSYAGQAPPYTGDVAQPFSAVRNSQDALSLVPPRPGFTPPSPPTDAQLRTAVEAVFARAAKYWEQRFDDPWTLIVYYGFSEDGAPGTTQFLACNGVATFRFSCPAGQRPTEANIRIRPFLRDKNTGWYLDPSPMSDEEYQPFTVNSSDFGTGLAALNTQRTTASRTQPDPNLFPDPTEPPSTGWDGPLCHPGGFHYANPPSDPVRADDTPCGAYPDLMGIFLHELAHALNMDDSSLGSGRLLDPSDSSRMRVPQGPYRGITIPVVLNDRRGGHAELPSCPQAADIPCGELMVEGRGAEHRKLLTDVDTLVIASAADFKRVNLDPVSYVTLPNFADFDANSNFVADPNAKCIVNGVSSRCRSVLTAAGSAQTVGGVFQLTPDKPSQIGQAFLTKPFIIGPQSSFDTHFVFRIRGASGAATGGDGLAFVIHKDPLWAVHGNDGKGLGFGVNTTATNPRMPISPSVAIEFDTDNTGGFDPSDNHVAVIQNGDITNHTIAVTLSPCSPRDTSRCFNSGADVHVWVEYAAVDRHLQVFVSNISTKPLLPTIDMTTTVDILADVGEQLFFGFTAATGARFNIHEVVSWDLAVWPNVAPGTLGDLNSDGTVNCSDIAVVRKSLGLTESQNGFDVHADVNGDGIVNVRDLALISQKLVPGTRCP